MKKLRFILVLGLILICGGLFYWNTTREYTDSSGARHIPSRTIPVPTTVSEEMQQVIARPLSSFAMYSPLTISQWEKYMDMTQQMAMNKIQNLYEPLFPVKVENTPIGGVNAYTVTPPSIPPENRDRLVICIHGGGYILFHDEAILLDAIPMAFYGKYKILAIDYRMAPAHPFPAALDDVLAVYQEVIKSTPPENIAIMGTSAGGGLTASLLLKIHAFHLPMPAVVFLGTPWSDLTDTGDTYFTNEYIDSLLVGYGGMIKGAAKLYAGSYDMKEPLLSPVYGIFTHDFPPAILITGTRDLFLSNTVRLFRKLRLAGIEAELQVFEGMSHAFYVDHVEAPESIEAYEEVTRFFQKHLGQAKN